MFPPQMKRLPSKNKQFLTHKRSGLGTKKQDYNLSCNHTIDESTGQVFTESTASIQDSDDQGWTRQVRLIVGPDYRDSGDRFSFSEGPRELDKTEVSPGFHQDRVDGLKLEKTRVRELQGARSLRECSVETILDNISYLTLEAIACLPTTLVCRIWQAVKKRCLVSFDTWVIFSKLLLEDDHPPLSLLRCHQDIESPTSPLNVYAKPLTSHSFDFITSLSINTHFTVPELVRLSQITNLGVLEITHNPRSHPYQMLPPSPVSDRLIRAWHFAASNDGKFKVLRILRLYNHDEVTQKSLAYLNSFPALALFHVQDCGFVLEATIDAKNLGWKATVESNLLGLLEAACVQRAMTIQRSSGPKVRSHSIASTRQLRDGSTARKIPRSEVTSFLSRPESVQPGEPLMDNKEHSRQEKEDRSGLRSNHRKYSRWDVTDQFYNSTRTQETWESTLYASFSRIGEMRNDTDLERAGLNVDSALLVGENLVTPVPIVSLRLGTPDSFHYLGKSTNKTFYGSSREDFSPPRFAREHQSTVGSRYISFIRIKILRDGKEPREPHIHQTAEDESKIHFDTSTKTVPNAGTAKRQKVSLMKSKKVYIGDMLNSFR